MNDSGSAVQPAGASTRSPSTSCSSSTTRSTWTPAGCRHDAVGALPGTTGSARSHSDSGARTSSACGSASAGPAAATRATSRITSSRHSPPRMTSRRSSARAADAVEALAADGLTDTQQRSTQTLPADDPRSRVGVGTPACQMGATTRHTAARRRHQRVAVSPLACHQGHGSAPGGGCGCAPGHAATMAPRGAFPPLHGPDASSRLHCRALGE